MPLPGAMPRPKAILLSVTRTLATRLPIEDQVSTEDYLLADDQTAGDQAATDGQGRSTRLQGSLAVSLAFPPVVVHPTSISGRCFRQQRSSNAWRDNPPRPTPSVLFVYVTVLYRSICHVRCS